MRARDSEAADRPNGGGKLHTVIDADAGRMIVIDHARRRAEVTDVRLVDVVRLEIERDPLRLAAHVEGDKDRVTLSGVPAAFGLRSSRKNPKRGSPP